MTIQELLQERKKTLDAARAITEKAREEKRETLTAEEQAESDKLFDQAVELRSKVDLMEREERLRLYDGDWTFAPGLDLHTCHGHTPGQHLPRISGGDQTLFFCGDLVPMVAHFPTPYIMAYDLQPVLSMDEKKSMLGQAAAEGWTLFFEHDPSIEACRVIEENGRFRAGEKIAISVAG